MKSLLLLMTLLLSFSSALAELDLRKFQSPILDAKASAKSGLPRFAAYIVDKNEAPRIPGVDADLQRVIKKKYGLRVMNEYRLYEKETKKKSAKKGLHEKMLLERYCTRYNRQLLISLGM
jgi:hypothetical protein